MFNAEQRNVKDSVQADARKKVKILWERRYNVTIECTSMEYFKYCAAAYMTKKKVGYYFPGVEIIPKSELDKEMNVSRLCVILRPFLNALSSLPEQVARLKSMDTVKVLEKVWTENLLQDVYNADWDSKKTAMKKLNRTQLPSLDEEDPEAESEEDPDPLSDAGSKEDESEGSEADE